MALQVTTGTVVKDLYRRLLSTDSRLWSIVNEGSKALWTFALANPEFRDLLYETAHKRFNFRQNGLLTPVFPFYELNMDPRDWYGWDKEHVLGDDGMFVEHSPYPKERAGECLELYLSLLAEVIIGQYLEMLRLRTYEYPGFIRCGSRCEINIPESATTTLSSVLAKEAEKQGLSFITLKNTEYSACMRDPLRGIQQKCLYLVLD